MREWLTVIIVLLIAGILLDGLRRVRRARRETLRMSRKVRKLDEEDLPEPGTEVFGEPRVVTYRDTRDAESLTRSMRESFAKSRVTVGAPNRIPEQVALNLQESVPMLMESVEEAGAGQVQATAAQSARDYTQPPSWHEPAADPSEPSRKRVAAESPEPVRAVEEPSLGSLDDLAEEQWEENLEARDDDEVSEPAPRKEQKPRKRVKEEAPEISAEPEEVLIMNLMAPAGQHFQGDELRQALLDQGLRYGAMNIFHRHKNRDGSGPIQFSLANMVVPGTFDLAAMSEFSTPGVSMFLSLPSEDDSLVAFDCMAKTAQALAKTLNGELKDENRSVMTRQTIEHCRQRVVEFERKQRLMQRS